LEANVKSTNLRVFNPLSSVTTTVENAARLNTLQGKTICEIAATGAKYWRADLTFPIIRNLLQKRFPEVRNVPYTEFPDGNSVKYPVPLDKIGELLKEKECDAVLLGNGG